MKKVILAPDSFKGTLSAQEVCDVMERAIRARYPEAEIIAIPVADGGEGSVDCFLAALGGEKKFVTVQGVFGKPMEAYYGLLPDGETAVMEMASCAGLPLAEGRRRPLRATTYGVGELMLAAARDGAKHIILGLGGSATHDGGCGAAAATGIRFYNEEGKTFVPTGGTLRDIRRIDPSGLDPALRDVRITAMCDVDNPLYGKNGAAFVFGPQKGADNVAMVCMEQGMWHLSDQFIATYGRDVSAMPGGGAAGGMGAGVHLFFGAVLRMGIETVLDTVHFEEKLGGADMVFTGEGRIDSQSLRGKVVIGVARRAAAANVPVVAVVGGIDEGASAAYEQGVTAMFSINTQAMAYEEARHRAGENLAVTMENLLRLYGAVHSA
jgi:glycerate kinase